MKYSLLLLLAVAFFSCTRTKTDYVTVVKNDTTTITIIPNIIGSWKSSTGVSPIAFDSFTYAIQSFASIHYISSSDTIYDISETNIVYFQWAYKISSHNDTLTLTSRGTGDMDIYTRI